MEKAKVYFSDLRTSPTSNLLDKMERLLKRAGIGQLPLKDSFTAIKIHFGEPGNLAYIRPNYAARMANLLRSYNPQIQISAESETKRSIFREKDKTKRSKKESAQHSKSRNKSFVMTSVSAL